MSVKEAIEFRRNISGYDESKEISLENLKLILEAGRLAPSSHGLEPVKVVAVVNKELKDELSRNAFMPGNDVKVKTSSAILLALAADGDYENSKEFIVKRKSRIMQGKDLEGAYEGIQQFNRETQRTDLTTHGDEQAHIAVAYMGLQASDLQIGSTIMAGLYSDKTFDILKKNNLIDDDNYHVVLGLALGYIGEKNKPAFPRLRITPDEFYKIAK